MERPVGSGYRNWNQKYNFSTQFKQNYLGSENVNDMGSHHWFSGDNKRYNQTNKPTTENGQKE